MGLLDLLYQINAKGIMAQDSILSRLGYYDARQKREQAGLQGRLETEAGVMSQQAEKAEAKARAAFGSGTSMIGMRPNDAAALWQLQQGGPEGQLAARGLLDTFMQRTGQDSPQAQATRQGTVLDNVARAQGITQQGIMGPLQQQQAQASIDASRASTALNRLQLNQLMTAPPSLADKYEALTGAPVPSGYTPEDGPLGIRLRPHEGTDPHKGAVKDVRTAEGVLDLANQYADMVIGSADKPGVGAETWPSAEKGQARFIHGKLIGDMTEMARTGALNEHDLPRLYGMLPSAADKYVWTEADTAALEAFIAELERAVARVHEENWFIEPRTMPGPSDAFPWPMSSGR